MGLKIGKKSFKKGNHKPAEVCKDIFAEKRRENPEKNGSYAKIKPYGKSIPLKFPEGHRPVPCAVEKRTPVDKRHGKENNCTYRTKVRAAGFFRRRLAAADRR